MGILSWWKGSSSSNNKSNDASLKRSSEKSKAGMVSSEEIPGMNGAVEVTRPSSAPNVDVTVFEFGSVAASSDKVTLAGYCPVSDDLEPCRWEILPASASDAPQFRVVF